MQQRVALIEPLLHLGHLGGDGKMRVADPLHLPGPLAQAGIKGGAVAGMAGVIVGAADRNGTMEQGEEESERTIGGHNI